MHAFMKESGITDKNKFYSKYPDQESFFNDYPYMKNGGQINVEQNQALPIDRSESSKLKNVKESNSTGYKRDQIPFPIQVGSFTDVPQTLKKGGEYSGTYDGGTGSYYKKGGIHIKPENKGKFTEYKKRTGKTTEEALHSKDPHVRQMANFARNAKKWKYEEGGEVIPHKFSYGPGGYMQEGGDPNNEMERPDAQPTTQDSSNQMNSDSTGVVPDKPQAAWRQGMSDQQASDSIGANRNANSIGEYAQQNPGPSSSQPQQNNNFLGKGLGIGAGLFTDLALINNRNSALRGKLGADRSHGMTSSQYPAFNPIGAKGDYGTVGQGYGQHLNNFSYGNVGSFKQPQMKQGGVPSYEVGGVYEMSSAEIEYMKKLGYQIQHM